MVFKVLIGVYSDVTENKMIVLCGIICLGTVYSSLVNNLKVVLVMSCWRQAVKFG